jgi:hypothetical protein
MLDRPVSWSPLDRDLLKRVFAAFAFAILLTWTRPALAATVTILFPPSPSVEVTEALTLLRGELLTVGLDVTTSHHPADHDQRGPDSRGWIEDLAAAGASAIIDTVEIQAGLAVDVWIVRADPLRFEVTRVAVSSDTPKAPEVLSLRAVEALRAGLLIVDRTARKQQPAVPPPANVVPAKGEGAPAEARARWGLEAGAAALASFDGVAPAFLPMVRVGWAPRPSLLIQASLLGAGTRPRMTMAGGAVRVAQQYATLGACYRLRAGERLWPLFALAAGAMHTSAEGQADPNTLGRTVDQWSFLVDTSLGAGLQISRRFFATLAAHVQWAAPYVVIHAANADTASMGRPNLVLTLTVGAWL